jgi:hypothetical protein
MQSMGAGFLYSTRPEAVVTSCFPDARYKRHAIPSEYFSSGKNGDK